MMVNISSTVNRGQQRFNTSAAALKATEWGWLPLLSLSGACGLFILALADNGGRTSAPWADLLFWVGLLVLFIPFAIRLLSSKPSRSERIALLMVLGGMLYLVKVLQYPLAFMYSDEFQHTRTAQDILSSAHLFMQNPLLAVSPSFPGLEIVVTALSRLSGLPLYPAGVITLAVVRLVLVLALFLLYERISSSTYMAGIVALLFMTTSLFIFFESQFAYESLALPLLALTLWAMVRRTEPGGLSRWSLAIVAFLALAAITVTHHLATYQLIVLLIVWCIISIWTDRGRRDWISPWLLTLLGVLMAVAWFVFVARNLEAYLAPYPGQLGQNIFQAFTGETSFRPLFQQVGPQFVPMWERVVALVATGLLLLGLLPGLYYVWKHYRNHSFILALAVASLLYPVSLALRFTPTGENIGGRLAVYVFIPLAFLVTLGGKQLLQWAQNFSPDRFSKRINSFTLTVLTAAIIAIIFTGGVIQGAGPTWTQVPGPYIVGAVSGPSIDAESVNAAEWMLVQMGPGQRVSADLTNQMILGTYGKAWVVAGSIDNIGVAPLFTSSSFGLYEYGLIHVGKIHYLAVDIRMSTQLPALGYYFDRAENGSQPYKTPISRGALTKFDSMTGVSRVFDSGDIAIYDMSLYVNGS